jgi:prolyl 4-hydroxylase
VLKPKKGTAVIWNNLGPDGAPNYNTLHAAMPVEEGHKAIVTKWFRQRALNR